MSERSRRLRDGLGLVLLPVAAACGTDANTSFRAGPDGIADGAASGGSAGASGGSAGAGGRGAPSGSTGAGGRDGGAAGAGHAGAGAGRLAREDGGAIDGGAGGLEGGRVDEGGVDGGAGAEGGPDGAGRADAGVGDAADGGPGATAPCTPDHGGPIPARPEPGTWQRVDLPGAVCSNGSQYPIFVNYSDTSNNVLIVFEPGGACWSYESCSPSGGLRGAANPGGISDGHMEGFGLLPVTRKDLADNPMADWNMVFVPYCTGDIHIGSATATYLGPAGEELVYRHNGHDNVQSAIQWIGEHFTNIPQLLVTGCSAGGAASLLNYHFIRQGLGSAVQCSYLLSDSGPIFPTAGYSAPLHAKVREAWNTDPIIDRLDGQFPTSAAEIKADLGLINTVMADAYPRDRLSATFYRLDFNFSIYSYESFYGFPGQAEIRRMWESDVSLLRALYDTRPNLGYFIPYFRTDNCSHCLTIPPLGNGNADFDTIMNFPWLGTEVQESTVDLRDYLRHLLDDAEPLRSYFESDQVSEAFTDEEIAYCEAL